MMLFVVLVIGACYLVRFLLTDRHDPAGRPVSGRPVPEILRINRDSLTAKAPASGPTTGPVDGESVRWTALDDHQLRRLLEQPLP